jgi:hypothetical protein
MITLHVNYRTDKKWSWEEALAEVEAGSLPHSRSVTEIKSQIPCMTVSDDKMQANIKPIRSLSMSSSQSNGTSEIDCKVDGGSVVLDELPSHEDGPLGPLGSSSDDDRNYFDDKIHINSSEELAVDAKSSSNAGDSKVVLPPIAPLISLILLSVFPSSLSKKGELESNTVPDEYRGSNLKNPDIRRDIPDGLVLDDVDSSPAKEGGKEIPEELLIKLFSRKEVYLCGHMIYMDYKFVHMYVYV